MNKYLGQLSTLLFAPAPTIEGAVDSGSSGGSGASVATRPGPSVGKSPVEENIYGNTPDSGADADKQEDFTDKGAGGRQQQSPQEREDFTKSGEVEQTIDQTQEQQLDANGQPIQQVEKKPETFLKLDAETIAALRAPSQGQQVQPQRQAPSLTAAQLKEMLNPVEVTPELLGSLGFTDASPEQVAGFQNFANAIVKNSVSINRQLIAAARKEFEQVLGPLMQHHEAQQLDQTKQTFYGEHKDLVKYEKIVKLAAQEVSPKRADGSFKTDKEIMKEVADTTRATLKGYGVQLETSSTPANPGAGGGNGQVPAPNRFPASGRSGGDTNGQRGKPNDADADIYKR